MNKLHASIASLRNAGVALLFGGAVVPAFSQTAGTVSVYHLNANVAGRGPCVQMLPTLPQTPWACVWKNNPLYSELNTMLLTASTSGRICYLWLDTKDANGHWNLRTAECR